MQEHACTNTHTPLATSTGSISLCWAATPPVFCSARWKDFRPCFPVRRRAVSSHRGRPDTERPCSFSNSSGVRILSAYSTSATTDMSTIWSDVCNLLTMLSHWAWVRLSYCDRVAAEEREIANVTGHEVFECTHHHLARNAHNYAIAIRNNQPSNGHTSQMDSICTLPTNEGSYACIKQW